MRDCFDEVILASCGEKTRKFRILRGTTSIIIMDTHIVSGGDKWVDEAIFWTFMRSFTTIMP